jgi:uncharacterized integral membrane protein
MTDDEREIRDIREMLEPEEQGVSAGAVFALLGLILLGIFIAQNMDTLEVHYLWFSFDSPLWLMAVAGFVLGIMVGWFLKARRVRVRRRRAIQRAGR